MLSDHRMGASSCQGSSSCSSSEFQDLPEAQDQLKIEPHPDDLMMNLLFRKQVGFVESYMF